MKTKIGRERQDLLESKYNRSKENDVEIQGEITGAIYRNGPVASRGSTDTFFCGVYVLFLASLLAISIIGLIDGDIRYLYAGYDSDG